MDDRVRYAVIVIVTAVWLTNFAAKFIVESYEPSVGVDGVFGIIVGYLFLAEDLRRRRDDDHRHHARRSGGGDDG